MGEQVNNPNTTPVLTGAPSTSETPFSPQPGPAPMGAAPAANPKKSNNGLIIGIVIFVLVVIGGVVGFLVLNANNKDTNKTDDKTAQREEKPKPQNPEPETEPDAEMTVGYQGEEFKLHWLFGETLRDLSKHYKVYLYPDFGSERKDIDDIESYLTDGKNVNNNDLAPYIYFTSKDSEKYGRDVYIESEPVFGGNMKTNEELIFTDLLFRTDEEYSVEGKTVTPHVTTRQGIIDLFGEPDLIHGEGEESYYYYYINNEFEVIFYFHGNPNLEEDREAMGTLKLTVIKKHWLKNTTKPVENEE